MRVACGYVLTGGTRKLLVVLVFKAVQAFSVAAGKTDQVGGKTTLRIIPGADRFCVNLIVVIVCVYELAYLLGGLLVDVAGYRAVKIIGVGGLLEHAVVCNAVSAEDFGEPLGDVLSGGPGRKAVDCIKFLYAARGYENPVSGDVCGKQDPFCVIYVTVLGVYHRLGGELIDDLLLIPLKVGRLNHKHPDKQKREQEGYHHADKSCPSQRAGGYRFKSQGFLLAFALVKPGRPRLFVAAPRLILIYIMTFSTL